MRIQVSGKQIDVGEALRAHATGGLEEVTGKYAGRPTEATVLFSRDGFELACEITVHLSTGLTAQAKGTATEIYAAFDAGLNKMSKQLRRHKRRLKDHHAGRTGPVDATLATTSVLAPLDDQSGPDEEAGASGAADPSTDWAEGPAIIAETETRVSTLSVGEAVMQMELAHAPVLVFRNQRRGTINVVYRREDGTVGWIDPRPEDDGSGAASGPSRKA